MHWGNDFPPLEPGLALKGKRFSAPGNGIVSVTPADFDSDGYVDLLVVQAANLSNTSSTQGYNAYIYWRNGSTVVDDSSSSPLPSLSESFADQPFLFDLDADLIPELLVQPADNASRFAFYFKERDIAFFPMPSRWGNGSNFQPLPFAPQSSHAYYSFGPTTTSGDGNTFNAGLLITSLRPANSSSDKPTYTYERWRRQTKRGGLLPLPSEQSSDYLKLESLVELHYPDLKADAIVGPSLLVDLNASGIMSHIVPVCFSNSCASGAILVYNGFSVCL